MSDDVVGGPLGPEIDFELDVSVGASTDGQVVLMLSAGPIRGRAILPMAPPHAVWLAHTLIDAARQITGEPGGVSEHPRSRDPRSPEHLFPEDIESLKLYAEHGVPTGNCFEAVLANDLMDAMGRADAFTVHRLPAIVAYVHNELPPASYGSRRIVAAWSALHIARMREASAEERGPTAHAEALATLEAAAAELRHAHEARR